MPCGHVADHHAALIWPLASFPAKETLTNPLCICRMWTRLCRKQADIQRALSGFRFLEQPKGLRSSTPSPSVLNVEMEAQGHNTAEKYSLQRPNSMLFPPCHHPGVNAKGFPTQLPDAEKLQRRNAFIGAISTSGSTSGRKPTPCSTEGRSPIGTGPTHPTTPATLNYRP